MLGPICGNKWRKTRKVLTEARRTAQNAPDVRADRVAELRDQVANGTYNIDAQAIAQSLVREEPSLFRII